MHIHEYQAKTLFSQNNIKTPKGVLISNTKEANKACSELGGSVWIQTALEVGITHFGCNIFLTGS